MGSLFGIVSQFVTKDGIRGYRFPESIPCGDHRIGSRLEFVFIASRATETYNSEMLCK